MQTAIIGTGFVGRAWAISFARAGHEVRLWDAHKEAPRAALGFIDTVLPDLAQNDLLNGERPEAVRARIRPVADLADALDGAEADEGLIAGNAAFCADQVPNPFADLI